MEFIEIIETALLACIGFTTVLVSRLHSAEMTDRQSTDNLEAMSCRPHLDSATPRFSMCMEKQHEICCQEIKVFISDLIGFLVTEHN